MAASVALEASFDDAPFSDAEPLRAHVAAWTGSAWAEAHLHASWEMAVLLRGEEERRFPDFTCCVIPGCVWLHPGWEAHGWRHVSPRVEAVLVHFRPDLLSVVGLEFRWRDLFIAPPQHRPLVMQEAVRKRVLNEAQGLAQEVRERRPRWLDGIRLRLLAVLLVLYQWWEHRLSQPRWKSHESSPARVSPALELVYSDLSRPVSLSDAAVVCGFSKSHFDQVFRRATGVTYGQFARHARLAEAARLLAHTDVPLAVIAEQTGFADLSHFHHAFRPAYGCTPGEYRSGRVLRTRRAT